MGMPVVLPFSPQAERKPLRQDKSSDTLTQPRTRVITSDFQFRMGFMFKVLLDTCVWLDLAKDQ